MAIFVTGQETEIVPAEYDNKVGNNQTGDTVQNVNIVDVVCEGPIRGLVGGKAGVFFNDVSAEYAEFTEFTPVQDSGSDLGFIQFDSATDSTGTLLGGTELPPDFGFDARWPRSLVLINYLETQVTLSANEDSTITATIADGASDFNDFLSEWNRTGGILSIFHVDDTTDSYSVFSVNAIPPSQGGEGFSNTTVTLSKKATTGIIDTTPGKVYTIRKSRVLNILSVDIQKDENGNVTSTTIEVEGDPGLGTTNGKYAFRITEPRVRTTPTERLINRTTRGKIDNLQVQARIGRVEQEPLPSYKGVGGSIAAPGSTSSVNLSTIKLISAAAAETLNVARIDPEGMPTDSTDFNDDATLLSASQAFNLTSVKIPQVDQVRWSIRYSALQAQSTASGKRETAYAYYIMQARFQKPGQAAFEDDWVNCFPSGSSNEGYIVHQGKTNAPVSFDHLFSLEAYKPFTDFQIRIIRVNRHIGLPIMFDGTSGSRTDKDNWQLNATGQLSGLTSYIKDKLYYPYSALVSSVFTSKQFNGVPKRSYLLEGLIVDVPSNYTPREYSGSFDTSGNPKAVYTGFWDGGFIKRYTDNPAWVFYDIVTNDRYGAGKWIRPQDIDKFALYRVARYCDELVDDGRGGVEPRFRANIFLTKATDVYKVLKDMATVFLGIIYWQDGKLTPVQDAPADPVYAFSRGNVIDGKFNYESTGSRTRINQVVVTWNDPTINYEPVPLLVEDRESILRDGKIISQNSVAFGATSEGQAIRYGRWKLWTAQNQTEIVNFQTSLAAHFVKPGDIITIQDSARHGSPYSGRIKSFTAKTEVNPSVITLDREVTLTSTSEYYLNTLVTKPGAFYAGNDTIDVIDSNQVRHQSLQPNTGQRVLKAWVPVENVATFKEIETEEEASNAFSTSDLTTLVPIIWRPYTYVQQTSVDMGEAESITSNQLTLDTSDLDEDLLSVTLGSVWTLTELSTDLGNPFDQQSSGGIAFDKNDIRALGSSKEYRVLGIKEDSKNLFSISAVEYFSSKYDEVDYGFDVATISDSDLLSEIGNEVIPPPRNLRVLTNSDSVAPGEEIIVQWDEPDPSNSKSQLVTEYELFHNLEGIASPIVTTDSSIPFTNLPDGILELSVRSVTRKRNKSIPIDLRYVIEDPFTANITRVQEGIPKGIIATTTLIVDDNLNKAYFESDPTIAVSLGASLEAGAQFTESDSVLLSELSSPYGSDVEHHIGLRGSQLFLAYYDTETFSDFPFWKSLPVSSITAYSWTHQGDWTAINSTERASIPSDSNTITLANHGLVIRDKIAIFPGLTNNASTYLSPSCLQYFDIIDQAGSGIEFSYRGEIGFEPLTSGVKVRISNAQSQISLSGGGYLTDGEYYLGNVSEATEDETSSADLYDTYTNAIAGGTTGRISVSSVVSNATFASLRAVAYAANVICIVDENTFIIDRTIEATEIQAQNCSIWKRSWTPDFSNDSIFAKVKYNSTSTEYELTRFINLDPTLNAGKFVGVTVSDPLIQYNFATEDQLTDPGNISITATAIGFKKPKFKVLSATDGIDSDYLDDIYQNPTSGFTYTKTIVADGTDIAYNGGVPETIVIEVVEDFNQDSPFEGTGIISKTTAGADGVSGKTVFLEAEDLTIIYNDAGFGAIYNNTDGDSTTIKFTASENNFTNARYKFTLNTSGVYVPGDFVLSFPNSEVPDASGFVQSNIAYVTVPSSYASWENEALANTLKTAKYSMQVEVAESTNLGTVEAYDGLIIQGIKASKGGYWTSLSNPAQAITTTSLGIPIGDEVAGFSDRVEVPQTGTTIEIGKGDSILDFVSKATWDGYTSNSQKSGKYTITSIDEQPTSAIIFSGSPENPLSDIDSTNPELISMPDFIFSTGAAAWTGNTATVTYNFDLEGAVTLSRTQVFSKSKEGFNGVTILQQNQFESVPVDKNGKVLDFSITANGLNVVLIGVDIPFYVDSTAAAGASAEYWWEYVGNTPIGITFPSTADDEFSSAANNGETGFISFGAATAMSANSATVQHTVRVHIGSTSEDYIVTQTITKNTNASNISAYVTQPHYSFDGDGGSPSPNTAGRLYWNITVPEAITNYDIKINSTSVDSTEKTNGYIDLAVPAYGNGEALVYTVELWNNDDTATLLDTDTVSISKSKSGANNIILELDNDSATISGTAGSNVTGFSESTTVTVFRGTIDDTSNWTFNWAVSSVGTTGSTVTGSPSGATYTVTALNNASGGAEFTFANITVTATNPSYDTHEKTFTITKVANGENGVSYRIVPATASVVYNPDTGTYTGGAGTDNDEVVFNFKKIENGVTSDFTGQYSINGGSLQNAVTGFTYTDFGSSASVVTVSLYDSAGTNLLDQESVPLILNGVEGAPGDTGATGDTGDSGAYSGIILLRDGITAPTSARLSSIGLAAADVKSGTYAICFASPGSTSAKSYRATQDNPTTISHWAEASLVTTNVIAADAIRTEQLHISKDTGDDRVFIDGENNRIDIYNSGNLRVRLGNLQ